MQIRFADARPTGEFALVLPSSGSTSPGLDSLGAAKAGVAAALKRSRFEGDAGSAVEIFLEGDGGRRLIVVGTGSKANDGDAAEKFAGAAIARLLTSGETHAVIDLTGLKLDADAAARVAFAAALRSWRYDRYRTRIKEKQKATLTTVTIVGAGQAAEERYATRYAAVVEGVALTRELVTEPANIIYPESFVERVTESVKGLGLEIQVLDRGAMEKLGMGALLGVSQGSVREPRMLVMKWNGGKAGEAPVALIGKGVTFDTGGISIKPAQNMEAMKWDMGGAGAVAGAMKAIAGRKAKANVVGVCGLVENMPDGNAQRPGDVVTTMSGQTVEVINTDAEGRLVLCDAMTWTQRTFKPKSMIDLATLTGAMVITLGHEYAGIFSNDETLAGQLIKAADESGDKLWRQPMGDAYDRLIDSPIADMKNVGPREAGSITAAQFLLRYVEDNTPWAHLDIAGMAWADKASATAEKGATGYGVRLLDKFIADTAEA
ncbi:leucyl aminopeptidase [Sphingomonas sp. NSE70-1]|uniref:Probable cytosol aminopeptidase n=1 Tax=Sphingomonas caseinilyticus TaxID=2908205 RepID=A0ABT0RRR2_9SPHN|nr:leucyl aminopeptidase [Sphingomonas caseinilyticus]MCL6697707.1 leucyl aminopeptidase [Sphingomonas caseinilyticus]